MAYNNIGLYIEKLFGETEFVLYSSKDLKQFFEDGRELVGTKVVKRQQVTG